MKLIKDGQIITSTERAYEVVYKGQGYTPYEDKVEEENITIGINDVTKADIIDELEYSGIEYDPKMKKQELFDLLGSD